MNSAKILIPAILLSLSGAAHAQNALGDGRALDNNLQRGSGRVNAPRRGIQDDLNFRNAIVTGNVANGREFRGDIGYTAANDFRGSLGSDDLFRFQANTAFNSGASYLGNNGYSGLATNNLRGLGAIQMQLDLPVLGQTEGLAGNLIVNRAGSGLSGAQVEMPTANSRVDPFGSITRSLRSTSAFLIDNSVQPEIVATMGAAPSTDPNNPGAQGVNNNQYQMFLTASELHGVKPLSEVSPAIGRARRLSTNPLAPDNAATTNALPPSGLPGDQSSTIEPVKTTGDRVQLDPVSPRLEPKAGTYEAAIQELKVRADKIELASGSQSPIRPEEPVVEGEPGKTPETASATGTQPMDNLSRSLDQLRAALTNQPEEKKPEATEPAADPSKANPDKPAAEIPEDTDAPKTRLETVQRIQKMLAESDVKINTLTPPQNSGEIFVDHMTLGEKAMAEGRWFDAEERFTAAIAIKHGDAMAAAGRVNSQLAAGMYLSSGMNLRNLLRAYPELIGVRFGENLLPRAERLEKVRTQLRGRAKLDSDMARDAGFLLAYLGHQTGNAQDVTDGFAIIDRVDAAQKVETDQLTTTCKAVWVK